MTATDAKAIGVSGVRRKRAALIRGVVRDAKILGVNRDHLSRVLRAERVSPKLLARYQALQMKRLQLTSNSVRKTTNTP